MKIALSILVGLVALVLSAALFFYVVGLRMPREHRAEITVTLPASRPTVWAALTDYSTMPQWWPAVKSIRIEKLSDGTELTWNVDRHGQEIPFVTAESRLNEKLVRVIAKNDLPFGGSWTYELADAGAGQTKLTLTEDGFINPPIFRAMAKWFFGLDATMKDFISHLEPHVAALQRKEATATR
ncbi:MAG: hypothetical protein JWM32_2195 [Verrucomicrobia bacterium]|nr:hypothetical protein [Verrucomicrobiota bacterium]